MKIGQVAKAVGVLATAVSAALGLWGTSDHWTKAETVLVGQGIVAAIVCYVTPNQKVDDTTDGVVVPSVYVGSGEPLPPPQ